MYESDAYPFASETITQTLSFPQPLVTTKIRIDNMVGASGFVFQVEVLGMNQETKARQFGLPFEGGSVFKSKNVDKLSLHISTTVKVQGVPKTCHDLFFGDYLALRSAFTFSGCFSFLVQFK